MMFQQKISMKEEEREHVKYLYLHLHILQHWPVTRTGRLSGEQFNGGQAILRHSTIPLYSMSEKMKFKPVCTCIYTEYFILYEISLSKLYDHFWHCATDTILSDRHPS